MNQEIYEKLRDMRLPIMAEEYKKTIRKSGCTHSII